MDLHVTSHGCQVTGFKDVSHDDANALKEAVATGPVSIAIEADKGAFQSARLLGTAFRMEGGDRGAVIVRVSEVA